MELTDTVSKQMARVSPREPLKSEPLLPSEVALYSNSKNIAGAAAYRLNSFVKVYNSASWGGGGGEHDDWSD